MSGTIEITSMPGTGSTVMLTVPLSQSASDQVLSPVSNA